MRVHGMQTSLRRATDDDVARLVAWHNDPEVARFWDDERFTVPELQERLGRPDVEAWIAGTSRAAEGRLRRRVAPSGRRRAHLGVGADGLPALVGLGIVLRVAVGLVGIGDGRLLELVVPVVGARAFHILFGHEGRPSRPVRA